MRDNASRKSKMHDIPECCRFSIFCIDLLFSFAHTKVFPCVAFQLHCACYTGLLKVYSVHEMNIVSDISTQWIQFHKCFIAGVVIILHYLFLFEKNNIIKNNNITSVYQLYAHIMFKEICCRNNSATLNIFLHLQEDDFITYNK